MSEVMDIQMSYEGLVEAGRAARERADTMQWEEGDLALQVESLPPGEGPRDPETGEFIEDEKKALQRYAEDVDISYATLQEYRRTASSWPVPTRVGAVSWKAHQILAAQEDRFDLIQPGMTKRDAEKIVRKRNAATSHEPGWFELLGAVADTLAKAEKQIDRVEGAITRDPSEEFLKKAARYADTAADIEARLRKIAGTA